MTEIQQFIKPELLILIPVLFFVGVAAKKSEYVGDKHIPIILGMFGIILSCLYVCGTEGFSILGVFTALTQGILCAGMSVYVNQIIKQQNKE